MKDRSKTLRILVMQGIIAAIYVVLATLLQAISFGPVQFRVSEALTVLPFLSPYCIVGVTLGCFISNLIFISVNGPLDLIFGTLATFLVAVLTSKMKNRWLAPLPPVIVNAVIIGAMLAFVLTPDAFWINFWINMATVGLGQVCACYILGMPLMAALERTKRFRADK